MESHMLGFDSSDKRRIALSSIGRAATCAMFLLVFTGMADPHAKAVHVDPSGRPQAGLASFYGTHAQGKPTASGDKLKPGALTAASKTLPLGTQAKVVNRDNGKSIKVVITDRGPFVKNRILDVSPKAAKRLDMKTSGVAPVKVVPLKEPKVAAKAGGPRPRP
jgi:rare lipoprotein A